MRQVVGGRLNCESSSKRRYEGGGGDGMVDVTAAKQEDETKVKDGSCVMVRCECARVK